MFFVCVCVCVPVFPHMYIYVYVYSHVNGYTWLSDTDMYACVSPREGQKLILGVFLKSSSPYTPSQEGPVTHLNPEITR